MVSSVSRLWSCWTNERVSMQCASRLEGVSDRGKQASSNPLVTCRVAGGPTLSDEYAEQRSTPCASCYPATLTASRPAESHARLPQTRRI